MKNLLTFLSVIFLLLAIAVVGYHFSDLVKIQVVNLGIFLGIVSLVLLKLSEKFRSTNESVVVSNSVADSSETTEFENELETTKSETTEFKNQNSETPKSDKWFWVPAAVIGTIMTWILFF